MTRQRRIGLFVAVTTLAVTVIAVYLGIALIDNSKDDGLPEASAPVVKIVKGDMVLWTAIASVPRPGAGS